jgi:hypothetical protein
VAVAVLGAGGIAYAATSDGSSPSPAPTTTTTTVPSSVSRQHSGAAVKRHVVRGTVTAVHGTTWTVRTAKGITITVRITAQTRFGTKAAPATATSFPVGSKVGIVGRRTGQTAITATRVYTPKVKPATTSPTTTAPPG